MNKKSFFFGLGVGFVILSIVFYAANRIDNKVSGKNEKDGQVVVTTPTPTQPPTPVPTEQPTVTTEPEPIIITVTEELTDDDIIQRAAALGMTFAAEQEIELEVEPEIKDGFITVTITPGLSSARIAEILAENGVVDNAEAFNEFLVEKGVHRRLRTGDTVFPLGADYTEIMNVLIKVVRY